MSLKQVGTLLCALFLTSLFMATAWAQGTNAVKPGVKPTPSPTPNSAVVNGAQRKAGGETGTLSCNGKPAKTTQRKAGGEAGTLSCDGKTANTKERKAGGETGELICWRKPNPTTQRKAGGEAGTISCNGKSANNTKIRKAGGETGIVICNEKPANNKMRKAGGDPNNKTGNAGVVIAIQPTNNLNGDGKTANKTKKGAAGITDGASHKAGGTTGFICDGAKPAAANGRKAGGQGIVRPNCSSATKGAIGGTTGGAAKTNVPQTQVPK
jgi:hypothetical protein